MIDLWIAFGLPNRLCIAAAVASATQRTQPSPSCLPVYTTACSCWQFSGPDFPSGFLQIDSVSIRGRLSVHTPRWHRASLLAGAAFLMTYGLGWRRPEYFGEFIFATLRARCGEPPACSTGCCDNTFAQRPSLRSAKPIRMTPSVLRDALPHVIALG